MKIIPVVAFSHKDSAQAARMLHWCADLSGQQPNTIILGYESGVNADAVLRAASRAFGVVEHLPLRSSWDAWPGSANDYFASTATAMRGRAPWLWLEPDCVPIRPRWLADLENEFQRCGKLAVGPIIPAWFEQRDGNYEQIGEMLAGVAVYHPGLWDRCPVLRSLRGYNAIQAAAKLPPMAFDCRSRHEFLKVSIATPLIQHMGRSREFRREEGRLVCSYGPGSKWPPALAPETVLMHGCKDESLIDLLRAEMGLPAPAAASASPLPAVRVIATERQPAATLAWGKSDALPPERIDPIDSRTGQVSVRAISENSKNGHAAFPKNMGETVRPSPPDEKAMSVLAEAREAITHWPECGARVFTLQMGRNDRFRVLCQCGAMSSRLAEGIDWEMAWASIKPVDETEAEVQDTSAASDASAQLQERGGQVESRTPHKPEIAGSNPAPAIGFTVRLLTPTEAERRLMLEIEELKRQRDERAAYWEVRERELLARIPPTAVASFETAPVRRRGKAKKKRERTPEEQAKINLRMASLRARKTRVKAGHQKARREHR